MDLKGTVSKKCEEILGDKSPSRLFILVFSVLLGIFVLCGILTGGESIRQTLFVDSHDTFMDFFNSVMYSSDYPYHKYHDIYPPLITLFYGLIGYFTIPWLCPCFGPNSNFIEGDIAFQLRNSQLGLLFFFVFTILILFAIYELNNRLLSSKVKHPHLISLIILCSFPMVYAIERGNSILIIIPLVMLFLSWYDSENKYKRYAAFILIGLATSIKIYVMLFLLLYLRERRFKDLFLCLIPILALFFIPFLLTDGTVFNWFTNSFGFASTDTTVSFINLTTMVNALKLALPENLCKWVYYFLLILLYTFTLLTILFAKNTKKWKIITIISCAISLGIGTGSTYNWTLFAMCFVFFLLEEHELNRLNISYFIFFILILCWLPALINKDIAYELHAVSTLALCIVLSADNIRRFNLRKGLSEPPHTPKRISASALIVFIVTMGMIASSLAVPLITENDTLTVSNHGYNNMIKINSEETIEFSYDPHYKSMMIGETGECWLEIEGLNLLSTDKGYLSNNLLMYLDPGNNRITKTISGIITGTISGNHVHLESNGWTADWTYLAFGFIFSEKGSYTCFSNYLPDWRIFLEDNSQIYATYYSDVADKLVAVQGTDSYSDGIVSVDSVSYNMIASDAGFGSLQYIWNNSKSSTVTYSADNSDCPPAYIVPIEIHTVKNVTDNERGFIFLCFGALVALTCIGAVILYSKRIP